MIKIKTFINKNMIECKLIQVKMQAIDSLDTLAKKLGCKVSQIARTHVWRTILCHNPVVTITPSNASVDLDKLRKATGMIVTPCDIRFIEKTTGYQIGNLPPFGFQRKVTTFIDRSLLSDPFVYCLSGSEGIFMRIWPEEIARVTGGHFVELKENKQNENK